MLSKTFLVHWKKEWTLHKWKVYQVWEEIKWKWFAIVDVTHTFEKNLEVINKKFNYNVSLKGWFLTDSTKGTWPKGITDDMIKSVMRNTVTYSVTSKDINKISDTELYYVP